MNLLDFSDFFFQLALSACHGSYFRSTSFDLTFFIIPVGKFLLLEFQHVYTQRTNYVHKFKNPNTHIIKKSSSLRPAQ